jgi:hypothetical protein
MGTSILFWRRTDLESLERLVLAIEPERIAATGTVISLEAGGIRLEHSWRLDAQSSLNAGARKVMACCAWNVPVPAGW